MPIFVCEKCGNIENTATGLYWSRNADLFKDKSLRGKALCCKCIPKEYSDGSPTGYNGKWHNKFPEMKYDPEKHKDWDIINKPKEDKNEKTK